MLHARDGGRSHGYTNPKRRLKLQPSQIKDIRESNLLIENQESIGKRHGISRRMVGMIRKGSRWNPEFESRAVP
jgi:hypothetical protein